MLRPYTTFDKNSTSVEAYSTSTFDGAGRVRGTAADHPGSAGGYRAQYFIYDKMGRLVQQSNPTEINGYWTPTGDDSSWVYTQQAYAWNGAPTVTTNPDGTTQENTYSTCGCAGTQQITSRDERGRRRRGTMDELGRLSKIEELNWDQNVYSTTNYAYNLRDQVTSITQAGDRVRGFDYDGYGRLWHKTTPEQGATTYTYFADDTTQTVTDARGATTTFGYDLRRLVTGVTYGVPSGVAATSNVSFAYDAAGNRTSMTDGLGTVSYGYDQLSRLTSENRTFTGVGSFALNYQYNVAGELSSVTNPWNAQVGYGYDKVGQITGVSGSGYYGVASYINNVSYRAFGAAKQINYGNSRTLSLAYDNRLRLTQWNIPNVLGYSYAYNYFGENSGRVTFASNLNNGPTGRDATLDRSYDYDHLGRLLAAYSGTAALAHTGQGSTWGGDGPYAQDYGYDVWGNLTHRGGWGGENTSYNASFNSNNQRVGSSYDASGNILSDGGQTFTYDATGQQATATFGTSQFAYDGDGVRAKKIEYGGTKYYLRSTALGGQVVCEITSSGGWNRGYVYLGGQMLAIQQAGVTWVHQEPITKGQRLTDSSGNITSTVELDPWGGTTNRSVNSGQQPHRYTTYERDGNQSDDALMRHYNRWWSRFDQPDPYDGSYESTDPQSFNRYAYTQNDPVNFTDPSGLEMSFCGAEFSFSDCGGGGGFWGGDFGGHVAEYNREYGGLSRNIAEALHLHNQRVNNAIGGYGFITNAEVMRIQANAYVRDPETGELVAAGSAMWIEDTPWHERGILGQIGLGARGFADDLTMGFVSWVERKQGRLSPAEEEWLANSNVHKAGGWAGFVAGLLIPGPGKLKAAAKFGANERALIQLAKEARRSGIGRQEAQTLLNWAREYGVNARNDINTTHWIKGPHIHIGPVRHIPVK